MRPFGPRMVNSTVLARVVGFFTSSDDAVDPERARQARMLVYVSLISGFCALVYGAVYVAIGMTLPALGCASFIVLATATLLWFRRTGRLEVAGHAAGGAVLLALFTIGLGTGGIASPAAAWCVLTPLLVTMVGGRRMGLGWAFATTATLGAVLGLDHFGVTPPSSVPPWFEAVFLLLCPVGLVLAVTGIVWSYEVSREDALQQVRAASEAAEAAHREARRVLDNVDQGLVVVRADGTLGAARSTVLDAWFGAPAPEAKVWELFAPHDDAFAAWLEIGWSELQDGFMPVEVVLAQLPARLTVGSRHYGLAYRQLEDGESTMLVVSDQTEEVAARSAEAAQREKVQLFTRGLEHPTSVIDFVEEARSLMAALSSGEGTPAEERRWLHTLKGNAGTFGLDRFASKVHGLEDELHEPDAGITAEQRGRLEAAWHEVERMVEPLLRQGRNEVVVELRRYEHALEELTRAQAPRKVLEEMRQWTWRSMQQGVEVLAEQSRGVARRIGKPELNIEVEADQVAHPDEETWRGLWSSLVHVVRNAIDHGIEPPEERAQAGKPDAGTVSLRGWVDTHDWIIEIADDGRGIDWARVEAVAAERGLPHATRADLERALFADGLTTRDEVTTVSGRGVGMAAVEQAIAALGGRIEVDSEPGRGTSFRFCVPRIAAHVGRFSSRVA